MTDNALGLPTLPEQVVTQLWQLRHDRAALMAMRSCLSSRDYIATAAVPYLAPLVGPEHRRESTYYLLAGLFADYQTATARAIDSGQPGNLGGTMRLLRDKALESVVTRHLSALCRSRQDQVGHHLIRIVHLASLHGVPINWRRLALDLTSSDWACTQRKWARSYYRSTTDKD